LQPWRARPLDRHGRGELPSGSKESRGLGEHGKDDVTWGHAREGESERRHGAWHAWRPSPRGRVVMARGGRGTRRGGSARSPIGWPQRLGLGPRRWRPCDAWRHEHAPSKSTSSRSPSTISFGQRLLNRNFLQNFELSDKNSRYENCRGGNHLQLSPRLTYVSVKQLVGGLGRRTSRGPS
jgi:hypothetical protein